MAAIDLRVTFTKLFVIGDVFAGWPYVLQPEKHILSQKNGGMNFDVLVNHAVFNKTTFRDILDNPKFIGKLLLGNTTLTIFFIYNQI